MFNKLCIGLITLSLFGCTHTTSVKPKQETVYITPTERVDPGYQIVKKDNWSFKIPKEFEYISPVASQDFILRYKSLTLAFMSEANTINFDLNSYVDAFGNDITNRSAIEILDTHDVVMDGTPGKVLLIHSGGSASIHFIVVDKKAAYHFDCAGSFGRMGEIAPFCLDVAKTFKRK